MTIIDKIKDLLRMLAENIHKRRRVVLALSCVVVFVTTYMLILPAFTLEKTKAAEQGGIDVPGVTTTAEDVSEDEEADEAGQADAEDAQAETGKTEDGKAEDSSSQSKDSDEANADASAEDPLTFKDEHYTIAVDDKNSVLPENTEIKVEEIDKTKDEKKYEKHFNDALAAIQEEKDGENVSDLEFARFYDISLVSDGKEVTLGNGDKVSVNIEYDKELRKALGVENKDNIRIIHFAENKDTGKVEAEVLDNKEAKVTAETTEDNLLKEAAFDAESFSVYGLIYVKEAEEEAAQAEEKTEETAANSEIDLGTAVVSTVDGSDLPEDVDGHADVVAGKKAIAAVEKKVDDIDADKTEFKVFDIALENVDESEYKDGFKVDVTLPEEIKGKDFRLFHIHDGKVEELDVKTNGNKTVDRFTFETENFSQFVLSYTVDFEYNGYYFTMPGGGEAKLSDILKTLYIDESIRNIKDVTFSNSDLLEITHNEGFLGIGEDWILKSLKSFDTAETLTITTKDEKVYEIDVTDPATQNIANLLTDVNINATQNSDGSYNVYPGQPYGIDLSFKEQPNGTQFDMTNGFFYPLPAGIINADTLSGKAMIELSGGDHAGESVELDYHLEGNNLVFSWPDQTSGAYQQLKDALYTNFKIHIEGQFNENATELKFSDTITKDINVKNDGKADVQKFGTYNPNTNSIDYTVNVTSTGICKNVVVTDTISGTALTYNNDATATSNRGSALPTPTQSGNGFTFTIPQMGDGETVTVRYSAAVNLDALTQNSDGTLGTVEQTGNKVKVTPENHPGDEKEISGKDFQNKIAYSTISKTSSVGETGEDGHATVTWTIKANEFANVSMAGHKISDLIDPSSQSIMKYSGIGITVVRKDANGNVVGTAQTIPWSNLTTHSDSSWSWIVPNSSPDTGKLSYEITYTTDVDVNGQLFNTNVKNTGTSDNGGSSSGSGSVGPVGGPLAARKVVIGKDLSSEEKTVTWEVNFDVPAVGLDSAVIDDKLPLNWNNGNKLTDEYKDGSITITPELAFGESYEVTTYKADDNTEHMKVTFYKTVNEHKVEGLSGTGSKRKIRVQFKTVLNDNWLELAKTDANAVTHENNANVILNGQTLGTQASVKIDVTEPEMSKTHNAETVNVVNNNQLPAWQFYITLTGVSDETFDENGQIVILDDYNSKYLDWYPHAYPDWEKQNGQVWGGPASNDRFKKSSSGKVMSKDSDGHLKIVINQADLPRDDNGEYYSVYTVPYYLTVKDPIAYQKLISAAANTDGGSIALYNTASNNIFGETEDKVDFEVPVVNKSATEPVKENGVYKLHYTIDVNKNALQLGDSDELVLTDEFSNISIDYTTVRIYEVVADQWGNVTSKTEVNDIVWDRVGYVSTYYLKNAKHYQIEYDAHLSGEPDDHSNLTYTNTAEVFGKKSTWEKTQRIDSSGSGASPTYGIKVLKHVKGNASQGLEGAKFKLYWYPSTADDPNGKNTRPDKNDSGWVDTGKVLTTDENGYAKTTNDMKIHSQTWYKLVEVQAPEGYVMKTTHYFFWITEEPVADYSNFVYINDDVMAINNQPELPETVDISVKKTWDDNSDLTLRRDIKVHLYADGVPYNEAVSGEPSKARDDANVTLHLNEDGTSETYTWRGLPSGYAYSVVEDPVPGYTTVYSPKNRLDSGELKITNKRNTHKTAISVDKEWSGGAKPSEDVTIQLKRKVSANAPIVIQNGGNNEGATGMHITDYAVPAGATVNLVWTYKNSWGYDSPALNIYNYGTKELIKHLDKISGSPTQHTLEVTVPPEGIIVAFEEPYLSSLSDFTGAFDFDFQVTSTGTGGATEDVNFTNERHYYTLKPDDNWHLDIDNLVMSDADGAYTYYIEEVGVNDNTETPEEAGYEVSYENNDGITHGTIKATNKKEAKGKIQVTKSFSGIDSLPENFKITNDYNATEFTVANADSGDGSEGSPYTWLLDELPVGTKVTFTESYYNVDGYKVTVTKTGTAEAGTAISATADIEPGTAGFVNTYEEDTTNFSFSKEWRNSSDQPVETWEEGVKIKVEVKRKIGESEEAVGTYEITKTGSDFQITSSAGAPALENTSGFIFKISDLPKTGKIGDNAGEYTYFAVETEAVDGYKEASYTSPSPTTGEQVSTTDGAHNGGVIINKPVDAVELPHTGGIGTVIFYVLGSILVIGGGIYFISRRRAMK